MILTTHVMCWEVSQCYDDVNICLWTNGSVLTQSAAQTACQQWNSFLPRVNNSSIQSKLAAFRFTARYFLGKYYRGFWIDVTSVRSISGLQWHWVDGSQHAGWFRVCANRTEYTLSQKTRHPLV